jgi:hypothetical protein
VTHYEVLGVAPTASEVEVRRAYVALARRYHPDRLAAAGDPRTQDRMRAINAAWTVLGDERRRRAYDAELRAQRRVDRPPNAPSPGFVPIVDDDTDYAALLDDTPVDGTRVPRGLQLLPLALLTIAVAAGAAGMVLQAPRLLSLGGVALVLSVLSFLAAPVFAVLSSHHRELD